MTSTQLIDPGQGDPDNGHDLGRDKTERPKYPLSKAAQMTGISLSTIKRKRTAGAFPHAVQDESGAWVIPVDDLLAAGLRLNRQTQANDPGQHTVTQSSDLDQTEQIARLERLLAEERTARLHAEQIATERDRLVDAERRSNDDLRRALSLVEHQLLAAPSPAAATSAAIATTEPDQEPQQVLTVSDAHEAAAPRKPRFGQAVRALFTGGSRK
jgi:hypothetical protein